MIVSWNSLLPPGRGKRWWIAWTTGLVVRLVLLAVASPHIYFEWFLPFLQHWAIASTFDPWTGALSASPQHGAFPYGPPYVLVYGLPVALGEEVGGLAGGALALGVTVLLLDLVLASVTSRLAKRDHAALAYLICWLSPITVYVCYWHGQLDVLPVLLTSASLLAFKIHRFTASGLLLGIAIAAKFVMGLALPFMLVLLIRDRRYAPRLVRWVVGAIAGLAPFLPVLVSPGFHEMVLATPETGKLFAAAIPVSDDLDFYVLPLVLVGLLLANWRIGRGSPRLLIAMVALGFFAVYLLTPASPGWSLWLVPFLAALLTAHGRLSIAVGAAFTVLAVLHHLGSAPGPIILGIEATAGPVPMEVVPASLDLRSMILSGAIAMGALVVAQIVRNDILLDPFFRGSRRPIAIGIAGDSGAGKDTLAASLADVFGRSRITHLSGDDYHIWDRNKPMWQALTHLNPQANHLEVYFREVEALLDGHSVTKRRYNHSSGLMSRPHEEFSRDIIITSGLHALRNAALNERLDLRIFLDMDETLRQALKIRRDVLVRGHPLDAVRSSIERRSKDAKRFVEPQRGGADLVFSLRALRRTDLDEALAGRGDPAVPIDMRMRVGVRGKDDSLKLQDNLISVMGAKVHPVGDWGGLSWMDIECGAPSLAAQFGARRLAAGMLEFISLDPRWRGGLDGVMQVIVLDYLCRNRQLDR